MALFDGFLDLVSMDTCEAHLRHIHLAHPAPPRGPPLPRRRGCGPPRPRPRCAALLRPGAGALLAPPCPGADALLALPLPRCRRLLLAARPPCATGEDEGTEKTASIFARFFHLACAQQDPRGVGSRRRLCTTRSQLSSPSGSTSARRRLTTRRLRSLLIYCSEWRGILQN